MLEVFNNLFMSIAEQMGMTLQNTACSVNIKERLDFSCAIFDADGRAGRQRAAYAGASRLDGPSRRDDHPRRTRARSRPGDVYMLNAPYNGGTHLPDITVVHAGVRRARARASCSSSRRAAITPISAASRRAR